MKLAIPDAVLKQHVGILGKTGAGKSSVMRYLTEYVLDKNMDQPRAVVPTCIIDPKGDWWGLKTSRNGKGPGYPAAIFGGEHADMPLSPRAGTALAELVVKAPYTCLIDLGQFMIGERTRFFIDFASTYFRRAKGARYLFIDEVHNFAPKGKIPDPDTGKMLHWANRLASEGRGKGITLVVASQRPQKVHNDMLTSLETLIAMKVVHAADRGAIKEWLDGAGDKVTAKTVLDSLADLDRGSGWVWSPEIKFGPEIVKFPLFTTYDSFAPQAEDTRALTGSAEVDLEGIKAQFAQYVTESQQNDPKLLRQRVAELEGQIKKERLQPPVTAEELDGHRKQGMEVGMKQGLQQGFRDGYVVAMEKVKGIADSLLTPALEAVEGARGNLFARLGGLLAEAPYPPGEFVEKYQHVQAGLSIALEPRKPPKRAPRMGSAQQAILERSARDPGAPHMIAVGDGVSLNNVSHPGGGLTNAQQTILNALKWLHDKGIERPLTPMVSAIANKRGGNFTNLIGALRTGGFIEPADGTGTVVLSTQGHMAAWAKDDNRPIEEQWMDGMSAPQRKIFEVLLKHHPVKKNELSERAGLSGGNFTNLLGSLRRMGAIEYPQPGLVNVSKYVFPE